MLAVAALSLLPSTALPHTPAGLHADKLGHFAIYAGMAAVWLHAAPSSGRPRMTLAAALLCTAYGAVIECLQPLVQPGNRTFSPADIAANTAGAFLGALLYARLLRRATTG